MTPTDVQIRRVSDNQLFSVEKVDMSSDGLTATLTLTNTDAAGAGVVGLEPNVDYRLIVATADGTASKEFFIPAVADDATVVGVDPSKKTITIGYLAGVYTAGRSFTVPDELDVDFANLLGETVTVKFDKTGKVLSINKKGDEVVIYSAFKEVVPASGNPYLMDLATEEKYYENSTGTNKALSKSFEVAYDAFAAPSLYGNTNNAGTMVDDTTFKYGKLVLNSDGTIRNFLHLTSWSDFIMVASTSGDYIVGVNKQEQTLKDYTILSDGYTIAVDDIEEGDIVFYNTTYKFAEVYDDAATGELEAVYDGAKFKFESKDRDGSGAKYFSGTTAKTVDTDYLKSLDAAGEDITVYYDRSKTPVFVLGETAAVVTTTETLVLTATGAGFMDKTDDILRLKGFNGEEIVTEDINVANLTEVKYYNAGAWKTWKSSLGKITAKTGVADHFTTADLNETLNWANTTPDSLKIEDSVANAGDSAFVKYDMVTLTKNDKGVVTKIQIERPFVGAAGDTFDSVDPATNPAFKAGYKTVTVASGLTGASIGNSAAVYIINKGPAITKTTYGEFAGQVANNSLNKIDFYAGTKTEKVSSLVIDNEDGSALGDQADGATTAEAVISDVKYLDGKVNTLSVITKDGAATYSLFGTDASLKDAFAQGDIVKITVLKDGETVSKIVAPDGGSVAADLSGVSSSNGSVNIWDNTAGTTKYNGLTIQSNAIITKIENNTVSSISLSDLKSLALKKGVRYSLQATGSNEIDSIVVTATDRGSVATELTNVFTAANTAAAGFGKGNTQSITSLTYNSAAVAPAVPDQTTITNVTTKAIYEKGAAVLAAIDIISADYNALSTSNTDKFDLQNASDTIKGYVAATAKLRTAVNAAATTLVVDNSPITNPTATAATDEGIWNALPTSVTVVLANGTEKELTISKGVKPSAAVTYTDNTTTMGDWALTGGTHTGAAAAEASKTYIFTYVNTNYTFETPITVTVTTPA